MTVLRAIRRFSRATTASAAIEFGIIAPIMVVMFASVVEVGRIYQVHNATNRLAAQYAIVFADCDDSHSTCGTELTALTASATISNIVPQLEANGIQLSVYQVQMSGTTPQSPPTYAFPAGSTLTATQIAAAQALIPDKQSGVIVTATYKHSLQFFQGLVAPLISAQSLTSVLTPSYTVAQLKS